MWETHTLVNAAPARKAPPPSPKDLSPPKRGYSSPKRPASALPQSAAVSSVILPKAPPSGVIAGGGSALVETGVQTETVARESRERPRPHSNPRYGRRAPSRSAWRNRPHSHGARARSRSESAFTHRQTGEVFNWLDYFSSKVATIYCRHEARRLGGTTTAKGRVRFEHVLYHVNQWPRTGANIHDQLINS